jgi:nucleoside-diphosphate-sugar epimerase
MTVGLTGAGVVVTGASGLMGLPLALALAPTADVTAVARFSDARVVTELSDAGVRVVRCDLCRPDLDALPEHADVVFHLAGGIDAASDGRQDVGREFELSVGATARLLARYRDARAFVFTSSASVYGPRRERPFREDDSVALTPGMEAYSAGKIAAEELLTFLAREWGIPCAVLRVFAAYGPRGGGVATRVDRVGAGLPVFVSTRGPVRTTPIFEADYVEKLLGAVGLASVPPVVVNLAGSEETSVEEYCGIAADLLGVDPHFEPRSDAISGSWSDSRRMEELLGPTRISIGEGVRRVVAAGVAERRGVWATWAGTTFGGAQ